MPLSEYEQRILSEIEQRLADEDPRFARGVQAHTPYGQTLRRLKKASIAFGVGFAMLVTGLIVGALRGGSWVVVFGLAAFAIMLTSVAVIATLVKRISHEHARSSRATRSAGWFGRLEERWRTRFERDEDS